MNLSRHFSLKEFTNSDTAARMGINNDLPIDLLEQARKTAEMMERIRAHLGKLADKEIPIHITSGYRCLALNRAIGSKDGSDHVKAAAVDFKAPAFGNAHQTALALVPLMDELQIGQVIYEFGSWVHVSTKLPERLFNRILTADVRGYTLGIKA